MGRLKVNNGSLSATSSVQNRVWHISKQDNCEIRLYSVINAAKRNCGYLGNYFSCRCHIRNFWIFESATKRCDRYFRKGLSMGRFLFSAQWVHHYTRLRGRIFNGAYRLCLQGLRLGKIYQNIPPAFCDAAGFDCRISGHTIHECRTSGNPF